MNAHDNFAGTGIRQAFAEPPEADDLMTEALAGDLAKELPTQSLIAGKIGQFQISIAEALFEKRKQQEIVTLANAKIRQLTISMQADEAALDSLLTAEA